MTTFNEHGKAMQERINEIRNTASPGEDATDFYRDLALANTALEDALMRYNSARYRQMNTWKRADPDVAGKVR